MNPAEATPVSGETLTGLRERALDELLGALTPRDRAAVGHAATRLHALLRERHAPDGGTVLVGYGGGKDSSYTVAFVRAVQLTVAARHGAPFRLRSATNRHAGMPRAVLDNIDRAYRALGMHRDPACELLLVDGNTVHPFRADAPQSPQVTARNRTDILMTGHRTHADARPTFCNACNLSMANSFGLAAAHGGGVDAIVTGDSSAEQRAYTAWISRLSRQVTGPGDAPADRAGTPGFPRLLSAMDDIAQAYFADIHGSSARETVAEHGVHTDVPERLRFFSIYGETNYDAGSHWDLLTGHLGFVFDDLAFSFTESDCANPSLMAHLRGLKCQYLYGRSYREGLEEYVAFALRLMRGKEFPQQLIDRMAARYADPGAPAAMRARMNDFARDAYGLDERQLICMIHSPFAAEGTHLGGYLRSREPELAGREDAIRALLGVAPDGVEGASGAPDRDGLGALLERMSGLDLGQLRVLYHSDLVARGPREQPPVLLESILEGDPHKERIRTRHSPDGPEVVETLSGR